MPEVLVQFETVVTDATGSRWAPLACGRAQSDGLWEGWIEFESVDGSDRAVRTPRESIQPNRDDLMYWAQGLTQTYLEGALQRALRPNRAPEAPAAIAPRFNEPVLDPFDVYQQGEHVLVRQLGALSVSRLRDIAIGFGLASRRAADAATAESLVSTIVAGVRSPPPHQ